MKGEKKHGISFFFFKNIQIRLIYLIIYIKKFWGGQNFWYGCLLKKSHYKSKFFICLVPEIFPHILTYSLLYYKNLEFPLSVPFFYFWLIFKN